MTPAPTVRTVADVMSSPVVTTPPDETVAAAAALMHDRSLGSVVVVDGDRPIGILTERDIVRMAAAGPSSAGLKVAELMTANPDCVDPTLSVQEAFATLADHGYRHIPVVEGDALVGIVSMRDLMRVAQIQPVVHPGQIEAPPGLEGVIVAETKVGDVRGLEGFYHYRQYSAVELADKRSLEDIWYLLFEGELPSPADSHAFAREVRGLRTVPDAVRGLLPSIAASGGPIMDQLRSAVSLIGHSQGFRPWLDIKPDELRANALQVCATVPTLIMALHRLGQGQQPIDPDPELGYGENYLWMLTGERPDADKARAVEQYQILTIDHGFNASTFTSRVITSTGADLAGAVTGGIAALSGPLHGGAPSRALDLLDAIGTPENARPYLVDAVTHGDKIMGFGHRVYKTTDPRSEFLRERGRAHRGREGGVRHPGREHGRRRAGRAEARPQPVRQRRVLRRRGDGGRRAAPRPVQPHVRLEPGDRLVRQHPRAGGRQPDHPPVGPLRGAAPAAARARRTARVTPTA